MINAREKGKIARSEWPRILARHNSGETLASIAKSFGCTGPAIRYIVSRETGRDEAVSGGSKANSAAQRVQDPSPIAAVLKPAEFHSNKVIDQKLRERVNSDIAAFLVAFDSAFDCDSVAHREALLEATDRLLRAAARTRIALAEQEDRDGNGQRIQEQRALLASG
jgi:hypothetical protein